MGLCSGTGRDVAELILSFTLGVKVWKGDLREARKEKLLEVGLELKVFLMESNNVNMRGSGVIVDVEVRKGLVRETNHRVWWNLYKRANGDVYYWMCVYGERGTVYGRMVNGVVVPV